MFTLEQRHVYIEKIRLLPTQLKELVSELTETQLRTQYLAGEWTVAQNVHHLADSHTNSVIRLKLILTEEHPTLKPYHQELWAELPDMSEPIEDSLLILRGLHHRWVALWSNLQETDWQRTGLHPDDGVLTVEDLLRNYAAHGEGHLDQITRTLAAGRA